MKTKLLLWGLVLALAARAPAGLAQDEDRDAQLRIDIRYLEERMREVSRYNSISLSSEFESLLLEVDRLFLEYPDAAEVWGISGIIKYNYQSEMEDVIQLELAEAAKNDLETAIAMDPNVMDGAPYIYLGNLYQTSAPWPTGFRDEERAEELLRRAVSMNPDDHDANYYLGRLLLRRGETEEGREYLETALDAPVGASRESSMEGRRQTIEELLQNR